MTDKPAAAPGFTKGAERAARAYVTELGKEYDWCLEADAVNGEFVNRFVEHSVQQLTMIIERETHASEMFDALEALTGRIRDWDTCQARWLMQQESFQRAEAILAKVRGEGE